MKKVTLAFVILLTLQQFSCKKSMQQTNTDDMTSIVQNRDIDDEQLYDKIIETISYGLLDLSQNSQFIDIVNEEIQKKFDEDDNALLKTINSKCLQVGINLHDEMESTLLAYNKDEYVEYIDEAINGFDYYGEILYPQIYIPFIENQNLDAIPKICLNKEDDVILPVIQKQNNVIEESTANEYYAQNNLLWVISVNETVNSNGEIETASSYSTGNKNRAGGDRFLEVYRIKIHDKKEGWGNGRADISHATLMYRPASNSIHGQTQGLPFCKLANPDLNTWYSPSLMNGTLRILSNNLPSNSAEWQESYNEQLKSVLFEKDVRKKFSKEENLFPSVPSNGGKIYFRSKETIYGIIEPKFIEYNQIATSTFVEYPFGQNIFKYSGFTY